jgi:cyanate lyase
LLGCNYVRIIEKGNKVPFQAKKEADISANKLYGLVKEHELSIKDVELKTGISYWYISKALNGRVKLTDDVAQKILNILK